MSNRMSRVSHHVDLDMVGLFEIKKEGGNGFLPEWESDDHLVGIWESVEACLDYCMRPDRFGFIESNRTLLNRVEQYDHILGFKLKWLRANTPFSDDVCEFRNKEEFDALVDKVFGMSRIRRMMA